MAFLASRYRRAARRAHARRLAEARGRRSFAPGAVILTALRLAVAFCAFVYLFRLALVLQKGAAGYAILLQPLREAGETGAALAALLEPDELTLSIANALAPLI